jgi:hypothetical protein
MLAYQVPYPPYSELYGDASFSWSLLFGYVILVTLAGLWAVLDASRSLTRPKTRN